MSHQTEVIFRKLNNAQTHGRRFTFTRTMDKLENGSSEEPTTSNSDLSIHGLNRVLASSRPIASVLWLVIVICSLLGMSYFVYQTIKDYAADDSLLIESFGITDKVPRLSICNHLAFDPRKVMKTNKTALTGDRQDIISLLRDAIGGSSFANHKNFTMDKSLYYSYWMRKSLKEEIRLDLGSFLISCSTHGFFPIDCNEILFQSEELTNSQCYHLQDGSDYYSGSALPLVLTFYFDPELTLGYLTKMIGAIICVTYDEFIPTFVNCVPLSPGQMITIEASPTVTSQEKSFSGLPCTDMDEYVTYNYTGIPFSQKFNDHVCGDHCYNAIFYERCQCFPSTTVGTPDSDCFDDPDKLKCLAQTITLPKIFKQAMACGSSCPLPCEKVGIDMKTKIFNSQITTAQVSSQLGYLQDAHYSENMTVTDVVKELIYRRWAADDDNLFLKSIAPNFASLRFHAGFLAKTTRIVPRYSSASLMANLGGLMGMWLGASFISVVELVHFVFTSCYRVKSRKNRVAPHN